MAKPNNPIDNLERSMHEPKRLAILSVVAAESDGVSFGELKEACDLTDGNLNRHLKVLEEEKIVRLTKTTGEGRARTVVIMTAAGRKKFLAYLDSLEAALRQAAQSAGKPISLQSSPGLSPEHA
ncbi:MAG: transcriptional regulator [Verrucomicrobiota bacterium JB024]|nr:transcriptional regulator [Verrucomicrobiota bacterium JB024]